MSRIVNCLLFALPFLVLEATFRVLPVSRPPHVLPVSAQTPVARFQPNVEYLYSRDWNFSVRTARRSNNFGFIHQADYRPEETTPLLAVIGDSFVEAHAIAAGRVYSLGLSGAPLSQYLVFAEFARAAFRPDAMAFFIIGNDFDESLLKYKSDRRFHYFTDTGELRRIDYELSAAKRILRESAFLRYLVLNLEPAHRLEAIRLWLRSGAGLQEQRALDSMRAIDYFLDRLPSKSGLDNASILFVLDAVRPAIYAREALPEADDGYHARMRRYFAKQASARGYQVVDMQPVFIARHRLDGSRFEVSATDGHWNALGHRMVAEQIRKSALYGRVFRDSNRTGHVATEG